MKEYHTKIQINRPRQAVWNFLTDFEKYPEWNPLVGKLAGDIREGGVIETFIVPLNNTYFPKLLTYRPPEEIVWQGRQVATFLLAGKHYYRLRH